MSVPYHKELFNNGRVRLFANFSEIKEDVADENLKLNFHATNSNGIPVFVEQLDIGEIRDLYNHLNSISVVRDGKSKSSKFIETTDDIKLILERLTDQDLDIVLQLLEKFESEEKVKGLLNSLSDLELTDLNGAFHNKKISRELTYLEELIDLELKGILPKEIVNLPHLSRYVSKQPETVFQKWIEANLWIFGVEYIRHHNLRKIAMYSEADLLMESVDGYLDLIELKRPNAKLLKYDDSHKCYFPNTELSKVLGQSLFYLKRIADYKSNIEADYGVKIIMPRVKIIAGTTRDYDINQNDCIRMLNSNLGSIQIITYDDLLRYGQLLLETHRHGDVEDKLSGAAVAASAPVGKSA